MITAVTANVAAPAERILLDTGPSRRGAHRIQKVLTCQTLYSLTRPQPRSGLPVVAGGDREPLIRGTIGHVALAHHYARLGCEQNNLDPEAYYTPEAAIELVAGRYGDIGAKWKHLMPEVYRAYASTYAIDSMKVRYVEYPCSVWVPVPAHVRAKDPAHPESYEFTQRWDLILEDTAGRLWIYDHKFVSKIETKTFDRYSLAMQFVSMAWLGPRVFGPRFGGLRLNLIGVGDGKGPFGFQRGSPPIAPDAVRRFPETLANAEATIRSVEALDDPMDAPRTYSETVCYTPYGACECYTACRYGPVTPMG